MSIAPAICIKKGKSLLQNPLRWAVRGAKCYINSPEEDDYKNIKIPARTTLIAMQEASSGNSSQKESHKRDREGYNDIHVKDGPFVHRLDSIFVWGPRYWVSLRPCSHGLEITLNGTRNSFQDIT